MFWEPHTASIDFCETNYLHSDYVAEIHNTWSSLAGLSSFGLLGLLVNNPTREIRHGVAYFILFIIGIGSAGLHGTLHWFLQSSDELPMLYLLLSLCYMCAELDTPLGKAKYPHLPLALSLVAVLNTAVYYFFQQFYMFFITSFVAEAIAVTGWLYKSVYSTNREGASLMPRKLCNLAISSIAFSFFPCWVYDMLHCHSFIEQADSRFGGLTPHIIWHFGAGLSAYSAILCLECCRMEELNIPYKVKFIAGFMPLLVAKNPDNHDNGPKDTNMSVTSNRERTDTASSMRRWMEGRQ